MQTRYSTFLHGNVAGRLGAISGANGHLSPRLEGIYNDTMSRFPDRCNQMVSPLQAHFLSFLVGLAGAKRILELGTFTGYSAAAMLHASPGATMHCVEKNPELVPIARRNLPEATVHGTSCSDYLQDCPDQFDFCFIDADKEGYAGYYAAVKPLIADGGLMVFDNVLFRDQVLNDTPQGPIASSLRAFLEQRLKESGILVPAFDGILICKK
jgi:caffeoyl-CoA O-methyltransferase